MDRIPTCKTTNLDSYLTPLTKLTQIKVLNTRAKTIKFSDENISINLQECELGNSSLDMTAKTQAKKIDKLDIIKI